MTPSTLTEYLELMKKFDLKSMRITAENFHVDLEAKDPPPPVPFPFSTVPVSEKLSPLDQLIKEQENE